MGNQVEMVRPMSIGRLAEPVHDVGFVWPIEVTHCLRRRYRCARCIQAFDGNHDVNHRLRVETGDCGATDMLNRASQPRCQRASENLSFGFEFVRPG